MISERARLVSWSYLVSDLAATMGAFVVAHAVRREIFAEWMGPIYPLRDYTPLLTGLILPVWAIVFYVAGLYGRRSSRTLHTEVSRLFKALIICGLVLAVVLVAAQVTFVSRPLLGLFLLLNAVFVVVGRGVVRALVLESAVRRRVLVAGRPRGGPAGGGERRGPPRLGPRARGRGQRRHVGRRIGRPVSISRRLRRTFRR